MNPLLCDFCGRSVEFERSFTLEAEPFTMQAAVFDEGGKVTGSEAYNVDPLWAACETCNGLIREEERDRLLERSLRNNSPRVEGRRQRRLVREGIAAIHAGFWRGYRGVTHEVAPTPQRQRTLATETLLRIFGERLRSEEPLVTRAMDPLWEPDPRSRDQVESALVALLRTGAIFILDHHEARDALWSAPPGMPELPPLPFPRTIVELSIPTDDGRMPTDFMLADAHFSASMEATTLTVPLLGLVEQDPGRRWLAFTPYVILDPTIRAAVLESGRLAHGCVVGTIEATEEGVKAHLPIHASGQREVRHEAEEMLYERAVNAAHLITARNVPTHEVTLPRPQRRELTRRFKRAEPKVYFVDLSGAGDRPRAGSGTREFHHRWMVSGAWVTLPPSYRPSGKVRSREVDGKHQVWRKSHIKGPAGAPWKGRGVHVDRSDGEDHRIEETDA